MDGVMEQLDALGVSQTSNKSQQEAPLDPWSPECFDMVSRQEKKRGTERPQTSMGIPHQDEGYETWSGESSQDPSYQNGFREDKEQEAQLSNYVERMEDRLREMHDDAGDSDQPPPPPPKGQPYERPLEL